MKNNKAPGIDRVPYEFYKNATSSFKEELANLFNVTFESGEVENIYTDSIIIPIFKKGVATEVTNNRGISFMHCAAKILMGVIKYRLTNWIADNNVLNEFQAGFRPNYSTIDSVFNLVSIIHLKFEEKKKYTDFL